MKTTNRIINLLVCLSLSLPTSYAVNPAQIAEATQSEIELAERLERTFEFSQKLAENIDRATFDLDALLDQLDYDSEKIIEFVHHQIAFEQYSGLLRGPKGTLMSRAGNSLDQAVLLAKLLNDAGYEARIASGSLNGEQSKELIQEMKNIRLEAPKIGDMANTISSLKNSGFMPNLKQNQVSELVQAIDREPTITDMPEFESFQETTTDVYNQFRKISQHQEEKTSAQILSDSSDYYWVESKTGASSEWQAIHPVINSANIPKLNRLKTIADTIPSELTHRIRLQMFIEKRTGDKLDVIPIMNEWEKPVANLVGSPLTFAITPNSLLGEVSTDLDPKKVIEESNFFIPLLNGQTPEGAIFFDRYGTLIDPLVANQPSSGIFATTGDIFRDAISTIGDQEELPSLSAAWMEITLINPAGEEVTYKRILADRLGVAARAGDASLPKFTEDETYLSSLLRINTVMIGAGRTPRGMVIDSQTSQWQDTFPGLKALIWGDDSSLLSNTEKKQLTNLPTQWMGALALLNRFDLVEEWSENHLIYKHEPFVAIHTAGVAVNGKSMAAVDIVHNSRYAFDISGKDPKFDPRALTAAGVWETLVEGSLLKIGDTLKNTQAVMHAAQDQSIDLRVIKPGEAIIGTDISGDAKRYLQDDLDRGYAVIVPSRQPSGLDSTGWWRIDPVNGETLGIMDDGRGQAATEYSTVQTLIAIAGLAVLKLSIYSCFAAHDTSVPNADLMLVCCVSFNYGSLLAASLVSATFALGTAGDVGQFLFDTQALESSVDSMVCDLIIN